MISLAVIDSGPLLASANRADPNHRACLDILRFPALELVIPALCIAEVAYLLAKKAGPKTEARFLRSLEAFDVQAPHPEDWLRIAELVDQYSNLPLGGTDASVIALAERLDTDLIVTLDRRHFAVKPRHRERFRLIPG